MRKNRRKGLASIGKHGYVGSKLKICKTTTIMIFQVGLEARVGTVASFFLTHSVAR